MTRRLRRRGAFELELRITQDDFISPPRDAQRNWLLNRTLDETVQQLEHLDRVAGNLVAGHDHGQIGDRTNVPLSDAEIMEDWQVPVMRAMSDIVAERGGDVLEVGFGRGVSATMIQQGAPRSHTIIECNDSVVARFTRWRDEYPDRDIRLIHAKWQDATDRLDCYDAVFFHTYPLNDNELIEYVSGGVTFAAHFFPTAAAHLRHGGVFTYLTNEMDSLSRAHQRLLLQHFREFTLRRLDGLDVPAHSRDDLWGQSMIVVRAVR